jgi:hypothetical protein
MGDPRELEWAKKPDALKESCTARIGTHMIHGVSPYSEFVLVSNHILPSDHTKVSKVFEVNEANINTPIGQIASEDEFVIHAIVPTIPSVPSLQEPHIK